MQVKRKSSSRRLTWLTCFIFLGILILAYFPVCSFLFFVKNDAFNGYFPSKYFISESLLSHQFPWWNPYINFGLPQYGDMNSGFWSPITWGIAYFLKYNAYTFTLELLLYLLVAGIGMFQLCRSYHFSKYSSYIIGASYLCSGYMVGHLQHFNWIGAAALLPWCLWAYHKTINKFNYRNAISAAVLFYLFFATAHPGLIIGSVYFIIFYLIFYYAHKKKEQGMLFSAVSFLKKNLWIAVFLLPLLIGIIMGYSDIIPFITRGEKIKDTGLFSNPFNIQSLLSLALPFATVKGHHFFNIDISMRNVYIGLFSFCFFIYSILTTKNRFQKFFIGTGLFFLFLSMGGIFNVIKYHCLPFIGYVRMPGEFMLFAVFSFLLSSGFVLDDFLKSQKDNNKELLFRILYFLKYLFIACIVLGLLGVIFTQQSLLFAMNKIVSSSGLTHQLKSLIDSLSFYDCLWIQGSIQLLLLNKLKRGINFGNKKYIVKIVLTDLVMATLFQIPFTGVGSASVSEVQNQINKNPEGIPMPYLLSSISENTAGHYNNMSLIGDLSFYNKQIGSHTKAFYPVELKTTALLFKDSNSIFSDKPYLFSTNDSAIDSLLVEKYKGQSIDVLIECKQPDTLVLQQQWYPYWKCLINGEIKKVNPYKGVFLSVPLKAGRNNVKFYFDPVPISRALKISLGVFLIYLLYLIILIFKRTYPS